MNTTRSSLLERLRNYENQRDWVEFHSLYFEVIKKYALSCGQAPSVSEDIAAECMYSLVKQMPVFRYDRNKGQFRNYLKLMVRHKIISMLRRKRLSISPETDLDQTESKPTELEQEWDALVEQEYLKRALKRVRGETSARQFEAFRLSAIEDWPASRVGEYLNMTTNQVYVARNRMVRRIRDAMSDIMSAR